MKHIFMPRLCIIATIFTAINICTAVRAETIDTRIGKLDFELGVPTKETVAKLYDEIDFQRACQLYLWALPVVNASSSDTCTVEFSTGVARRRRRHLRGIPQRQR